MNTLKEKIKTIPKPYFSLRDIEKISSMDIGGLKVSLNRLVKREELTRISHGLYTMDVAALDFEKIACEIYRPAYVSFESALAMHNVLSQKPLHITLASTNRSKKIRLGDRLAIYHHLKRDLFWGFVRYGDHLLAEPEKAFLDLAYLSSKGYAHFDFEEMNLELLNKKKLERYCRKFCKAGIKKVCNFLPKEKK